MPAPPNLFQLATAPASSSHLPAALLRQYADGTLAPAAQHRVEAHTLACPRCADVLEGLLQTDAATTDAALARLRQRLRWRVLQQPARRLTARPRWVMAQLTAAAVLLLGLVAGGWWTWQHHGRPRSVLATAAPAGGAGGQAPQPEMATPPPGPPLAQPAAPPTVASAPAAAPQPPHPIVAPKPDAATARAQRPVAVGAARSTSPVQAAAPAEPALATTAAPAAPRTAAATADSTLSESKLAKRAVASEAEASGAAKGAADAPTPAAPAYAAKATRANAADTGPAEGDRRRAGVMPAVLGLAPAPVGGYITLREHLRRGANAFEPEPNAGHVSGTVHVQLTIGPNGKIEKAKITRGLRPDYDAEALRLVCEGPTWTPGVQNGQRTAQTVDVTVPF